MRLIYLAHPVSGAIKLNLAKAKRWLKWLTESREHPTTVIAPWLTDVEVWDDSNPEERAAGLERCKAVIQRCDELWLVGGRVSEGMDMERRWAMKHGLTVVDVTALGEFPPDMTEDEIVSMRFLNSPQIRIPDGTVTKVFADRIPDRPITATLGRKCASCKSRRGQPAPYLHRGARRCLDCLRRMLKGEMDPEVRARLGYDLPEPVHIGTVEVAAAIAAGLAAKFKGPNKPTGCDLARSYLKQEEPLPEFTCSRCGVVISEPDELRYWTDGDLCVPCASAKPSPALRGKQYDTGVRLGGVPMVADPEYPENRPPMSISSARGEDRCGALHQPPKFCASCRMPMLLGGLCLTCTGGREKPELRDDLSAIDKTNEAFSKATALRVVISQLEDYAKLQDDTLLGLTPSDCRLLLEALNGKA